MYPLHYLFDLSLPTNPTLYIVAHILSILPQGFVGIFLWLECCPQTSYCHSFPCCRSQLKNHTGIPPSFRRLYLMIPPYFFFPAFFFPLLHYNVNSMRRKMLCILITDFPISVFSPLSEFDNTYINVDIFK